MRVGNVGISVTILLAVILFCAPGQLSATVPVEENHIRIIWEQGDSEEEKLDWNTEIFGKTKDAWWKTGCNNLGKALLAEEGPYGMGVFHSYACDVGEKVVEDPEKKIKWELWVYEYEEKLRFRFQRLLPDFSNETLLKDEKKGSRTSEDSFKKDKRDQNILDVSEVEIPASRWNLLMLEDTTFVDLLAVMLLDSLPMAWQFTDVDIHRNSFKFTGRPIRLPGAKKKELKDVNPPDELVLYQLSLNEKSGIWISEVLGKGRLRKGKKGKADDKMVLRSIAWDSEAIKRKKQLPQVIWAHSAEGRGKNSERFAEALAKIHKKHHKKWENEYNTVFRKMQSFLKDSTASGYIGVRYGVPAILADDPVLDQSTLISALLEIRGGPLEGLRLYADSVPKVKAMQYDQEVNMSWNKITFGKSWGLGLPAFVDRIDIVPKIGLWNFDTLRPVPVESHFEVKRFRVKNELSLNIEGGIEWLSNWYTIRLWGANDRTFSIGKMKGSAVTSKRFGFDAYWIGVLKFKVGQVPLKLVVLAYGFFETVNLSNPKVEEENVVDTSIKGVDYNQYIWGSGAGLAW